MTWCFFKLPGEHLKRYFLVFLELHLVTFFMHENSITISVENFCCNTENNLRKGPFVFD